MQNKNLSFKEGFLLVNKSKNWTSFDVVKKVRALTGIKKVGHGGTLDPLASGVLIIAVGRKYTKQLNKLLKADKTYLATMKLGFSTDTLDRESKEIFISDLKPKIEEVKKVLKIFLGKQKQRPPLYSAIRVQGKRLYDLARKNKINEKEIEIPEREIEIYNIELKEYKYPFLKILVKVSAGTYIRSLVRDIGEKLKTGAYLYDLIRVESKGVKLEECIKIEDLNADNYHDYLKTDLKI